MAAKTQLTVGLISLGCAKNLVDSEIMMGHLGKAGMAFTPDPELADVLVINTCSFIDGAKRESIEAIQEAAQQRSENAARQKIIVAGCLSQRFKAELPGLMPEVDAFIGLDQISEIAEIVRSVCATVDAPPPATSFVSSQPRFIPDFDTPRFRLTPGHTAWVKIAEGCNHPCSFCIIPKIRGRHRSRTVASIVSEARELVENGCRELNLISQDTTYFGMDRWEGSRPNPQSGVDSSRGESLTTLIKALDAIEGDFWIRLLYTHPAHWSTELMDAIAASRKVARYIDIPLQHISDKMLSAMRRETSGDHIRNLIETLRKRIPGVGIRTTFIVGFPGETQDDFDELIAFLEEARFERVGVFEYSREEGTRAWNLTANGVHHKTRLERWNQAMAHLATLALAQNKSRVGQTLKVLVDEPGVARTEWDAPEIDGTVSVYPDLPVGEFAEVTITGSDYYDLTALHLETAAL